MPETTEPLVIGLTTVNFAKALADETRQSIITHLCCVWLSVNEVVDKLGHKINQPTVSHHLKKLEEINLVLVKQQGRQRFYTLNHDQLRNAVAGWYRQLRQMTPLDRLD